MSEAEPSVDLFAHFKTRANELNDVAVTYKDKTFSEYVSHENVETIIRKFSYPANGDTSTVDDTGGLIDAFYANDLYKLSMAPVVNECSKHQRGCIVQFKVDLRMTDADSFNADLQTTYVLNQDSTFVTDLVTHLDSLKKRTFVSKILEGATEGGGPAWKAYWQDGKAHPIKDRHLIETDRVEIMKNYMKDDGATDITVADFHGDTVILNCIPVPKNPGRQSTVVLSVVAGGGGKPDIRATGYWPLCSWLETPLMQSTYEVLHRRHLTVNEKTYGAWIAESLYRTFSSMCFLANKTIKVALFSGRRTGGALFNLLQVYLWNQFDSQFSPQANLAGRNLGTSSFWALETLKEMKMPCVIIATGTHAHELSMTLNVLYPELDDTTAGFVGSQILGHLLYKRLSAGVGQMTPMLTDTVGTYSFLDTASKLLDKYTEKPALCSFGAARQDSGKLADYHRMMTHFVGLASCGKQPDLMASEVDKTRDFEEAQDNGYTRSGVGGLLGDSEKTQDEKILGATFDKKNKGHFGASMAVKIARVWSGIGKTGYTLKTGDGTGKVTIDDKALPSVKEELEKRAVNFQNLHNRAVEALKTKTPLPPNLLELSKEAVAAKQELLNSLLDDIEAGIPARVREDMVPDTFRTIIPETNTELKQGQESQIDDSALMLLGGRRTRRKARKHTKKHVRKNIRKSKNKKSRRSYRRKSKK
jgi:nicotinic acid phosphoribosyltransferase